MFKIRSIGDLVIEQVSSQTDSLGISDTWQVFLMIIKYARQAFIDLPPITQEALEPRNKHPKGVVDNGMYMAVKNFL